SRGGLPSLHLAVSYYRSGCVDLGAFVTADPLGRLIAGGLGWLIRQLADPWFRRRSLRVEHEHATRAQRIELLVQLLGTLRAHFTWLSGPAPTVNEGLAGQRAREIAEWIYANHPRFPQEVARPMLQLMNLAYYYADVGGPGRALATSAEGRAVADAAWKAVEDYKQRLERG
ncbi:MAG: hypothetical protein ACREMM_11370, partial [Gemmatimonadales bacterium]